MTDSSEESPIVEIIDAPDKTAPTKNVPLNPADAVRMSYMQSLPNIARPYLSLARIDRPVGIWLLALPCWIGLAFMAIPEGLQWIDLWWAILFGIGAVAMRGAGCTWNDITDRDIDAKVARTTGRPLPSGQVSLREAYIFLGAQLIIGFLVWLCLRSIGFSVLVLFSSMVIWTIAYDTIYALQDREDDALIGVKSTARLFGDYAVTGAFVFHIGATAQMALAAFLMGAGRMGAVAGLGFLVHGIWQAARLKRSRNRAALAVFKSNVWAGVIILAGFLIAAMI